MKRTHQTDMRPIARLARRIACLPAAAPLACAALCIALAACAQPPQPQPAPLPAAPAPLPPTPPAPLPPEPTFNPALSPRPPATPSRPSVAIPAPAPPSPTPTLARPSVAIAAPTAQPTPEPTPTPPTSPPADVAFTQITAGKHHACGLREDATALCWGNPEHRAGIPAPPAQTTFRQISAAFNFTCGLRQDAAIACWGKNSVGQATPPQGSFSEIAAGGIHACALPISQGAPSQVIVCWGRHFPNGAETLTLDAPISDIQSGNNHTCGLTPQADMICLSTELRTTEITPGPFNQLTVGVSHICAQHADGGAFCQTRDNRRRISAPPTKFVQIAAGWYHSCGITRANRLECWRSGRAGDDGAPVPTLDGEFAAISIGWRNSCALRPNGRAVCWRVPDYLPNHPPDSVGIAEAFGGAEFDSPVEIFPWPSGGLAVVHRNGIIAIHHDEPNAPPPQTALDLTDAIKCCPFESGMLSAALDPRFDKFPFIYVWYSAIADDALGEGAPGFSMRLARFRVNRAAAFKGSELVILETYMPALSHLGGAIRFGADGMLYLGIGDPRKQENAQALDNLQGKIIRIDVRGATDERPYRVPPDNPFVDNPNARPEIWAYGLRNPWRMAFNPKDPDSLFVADVGENSREEVSIATAGANLGWNLCEGDICKDWVDPVRRNLTPPAVAYTRNDGCAVIGGVTVPWLDDRFIFGDLCSRRVWLLERDILPDGAPDSPRDWRMRQIADLSSSARGIFAFGAGADGSVYVLPRTGPIMRLYPDTAE